MISNKGFLRIGKFFLIFIFAGLFIFLLNFSSSADVSVTATVGNASPILQDVNICSTSCEKYKALAPGTAFTVQVIAGDPNGLSDINWGATEIEIYTVADTNASSASWDHVILSMADGTLTQTDSADGCTAEIAITDTNCFTIEAGDWTVKFLEAGAEIYVKIYDKYAVPASSDLEIAYVADTLGILVSGTTGMSLDTTAGTFSGSANTTNNAFDSGQTVNAYIIATHSGNQNLELKMDASSLTSGGNTIADGNISWYLSNDAVSSTPFTGAADTIHTAWGRGTSPTSSTDNVYTWLDIPISTPTGDYTGTFSVTTEASS
ncbi:MAG: hypothetical protein PHH82_04015 [Candidatus ainarchaeum sp.]|nr:hypothetical protein [Candidatus ainarchaeum sp.]